VKSVTIDEGEVTPIHVDVLDDVWDVIKQLGNGYYPDEDLPREHSATLTWGGETYWHDWIEPRPEPVCQPEGQHRFKPDKSIGLEENPGVWGGPGAQVVIYEVCRRCGVSRTTTVNASARDGGLLDPIVEYADEEAYTEEGE